MLYQPNIYLFVINIIVCGENPIRKGGKNNSSLGISITDGNGGANGSNISTNIVDRNGRADNLNTDINTMNINRGAD